MEAFSLDDIDLVNKPIELFQRIILRFAELGNAVADLFTELLRYFISFCLANGKMRCESSLITVALHELGLQSGLEVLDILIRSWPKPHSFACSAVCESTRGRGIQ